MKNYKQINLIIFSPLTVVSLLDLPLPSAARLSPKLKMFSSILITILLGINFVCASIQIVPGATWTAAGSNQHIQAHGGGIIEVSGVYYLIGENHLNGAAFQSINCYSSTVITSFHSFLLFLPSIPIPVPLKKYQIADAANRTSSSGLLSTHSSLYSPPVILDPTELSNAHM